MIGSISYFALSNGSAIVTKQLTADGTSRVIVYKPEKNEIATNVQDMNFVTQDQMEKAISTANADEIKDLKSKIKDLEKQIETLSKKK